MQASVGRIVHYSDELSTCNAAIVTSVLDPGPRDSVTLMVFPAGSPGEAFADVPYSATPEHLHTWHWLGDDREELP